MEWIVNFFMNNKNLSIFLISIITIVILLRVWIITKYSYWKRRGVKQFPPIFPWGNFWPLVKQEINFSHHIDSLYRQCKNSYCGIYVFTKPVFMITDVDLIERIMIKDNAHFYDRGFHCDPLNDPLTGSILQLRGLVWKEMRSKLSPAFSLGKLKLMFPSMNACALVYQKVIETYVDQNTEFDARNMSIRYTVDVIGSVGFGVEPGSITTPDNPFAKIGFNIVGLDNMGQMRLMVNFFYKEMAKLLSIRIVSAETRRLLYSIVNEIINYRATNFVVRNDFMQMLIKLRDTGSIDGENNEKIQEKKQAPKLTIDEMAAQAFFFYLAGFETSAGAITFTLYEMAQNPEIQKRVQAEIDMALKKHGNELTVESMAEMVYLEKCIAEVLRMHPPVPFHSRECSKTYKIPDSDVVIEQGTQVYIPLYSIQHDAQFFNNPETFDPERVELSEKPPAAYMPFGHGPRACIGLRMGYYIVKICVVQILAKYVINLGPSMKVQMEMDPKAVFNYPIGGIQLKATKR